MLPAMLPVVQTIKDDNDRDYVQRIYEKYRDKMCSVAYSILKQKEESEDCVQDVMRKVVENIERFKVDDEIYLESLLYISTKNTALDKYRREYVKRKNETSIENFAVDEDDDAWEQVEIPCKDKSFDEILIDEENKKILRECISEL